MGFCKDEFQATKHAREKRRYRITKFEPERRWKCFLEIAKNEILREIWPYYEKGPVMKSLCAGHSGKDFLKVKSVLFKLADPDVQCLITPPSYGFWSKLSAYGKPFFKGNPC